jgi:hypothetical protein
MATKPDTEAEGSGVVRNLIVPAALSAAAGAAALLLTKRREVGQAVPKLGETVSDLPLPNVREGVGDLAGDLRGKLDDVLGKEPSGQWEGAPSPAGPIDPEFERRRRERQKRRDQRRRPRS